MKLPNIGIYRQYEPISGILRSLFLGYLPNIYAD